MTHIRYKRPNSAVELFDLEHELRLNLILKTIDLAPKLNLVHLLKRSVRQRFTRFSQDL